MALGFSLLGATSQASSTKIFGSDFNGSLNPALVLTSSFDGSKLTPRKRTLQPASPHLVTSGSTMAPMTLPKAELVSTIFQLMLSLLPNAGGKLLF